MSSLPANLVGRLHLLRKLEQPEWREGTSLPSLNSQSIKLPMTTGSQEGESEAEASASQYHRAMPDAGVERSPSTDAVVTSIEQSEDDPRSPILIQHNVPSLPNSPQGNNSSSSKKKERISTEELKRALRKGKKLATLSGNSTSQLQDQGGRLLDHTQRLGKLMSFVDELAEEISAHTIELEAHSSLLEKQSLALAQLRNDNQTLRARL
ncbi:hypothetical protein CORC01_01394 [Colletotrichum orchidophilum]|uniref:Uncharacterized protein n=1 Tax=Colletotrichum orchidophilum TaxID=1209926 RepID=A0A1G4BPF1_9PEZI|nr:uncharacterized protein CORC01_01394 [Colletotrichum orchidophilum]OHF03341.1 hypothetical protein CORC01_01394 [Colletotrichum orchidophilum]